MAGWYVRGMTGLSFYLCKGYNIVDRHPVGDENDDDKDLFTWLGYSSSKKSATRRMASIEKSGKHSGLEIMEFKLSDKDAK